MYSCPHQQIRTNTQNCVGYLARLRHQGITATGPRTSPWHIPQLDQHIRKEDADDHDRASKASNVTDQGSRPQGLNTVPLHRRALLQQQAYHHTHREDDEDRHWYEAIASALTPDACSRVLCTM